MPLPSFIHHGIKKERCSEMADPVASPWIFRLALTKGRLE